MSGEDYKKEKWCDMCHFQNDCEDKEDFLESDEPACPSYS